MYLDINTMAPYTPKTTINIVMTRVMGHDPLPQKVDLIWGYNLISKYKTFGI